MNKLIIALIAGTFAAVAVAQTPAPATTTPAPSEKAKLTQNPKAKEVGAITTEASTTNTGATDAKNQKANVAKSKQDPKQLQTRQEKEKAVQSVTTKESDTSSAQSMSAQQKANVEKSKQQPKDRPTMGTPANEKALQKASTP